MGKEITKAELQEKYNKLLDENVALANQLDKERFTSNSNISGLQAMNFIKFLVICGHKKVFASRGRSINGVEFDDFLIEYGNEMGFINMPDKRIEFNYKDIYTLEDLLPILEKFCFSLNYINQ